MHKQMGLVDLPLMSLCVRVSEPNMYFSVCCVVVFVHTSVQEETEYSQSV